MTIEAALVIPLFLTLIFTMILVALAMMYATHNHYINLTAVERTAYNWDRYDRDFASSVKQSDELYGLYEHDLALSMLSRMFQLDASNPIERLQIDKANISHFPSGKLRKDKLLQANTYIHIGKDGFSGQLQYRHDGFLPRVQSELIGSELPLGISYSNVATAIVIDGKQHIRGVDLLIYYGNKLSALGDGAEGWKKKAKSALPSS